MRRRVFIPVVLAAFALSGGAAVALGPTWNSGYNGWWPAGFGYPPVTVPAHNYPCSGTAYGPTFNHGATGWHQAYGAGTSCAGQVGRATLTISDQTLGHDGHTWFTIKGSTFTRGPITHHAVRLIRNRRAFLGHAYRTVIVAQLVVPNGHAGCSLSNTCSQAISITAVSRPLAP